MTRIKISGQAAPNGMKGVLTLFDEIWAHRPKMSQALADMGTALIEEGTISRRLRELVRLRIAFHNQCRTCMAVRYAPESVDENLVCSLEKPHEAPDLTDAERAALHYADLFCTNHLAIDEAVYDGLRQYFDEGELVELGAICSLYSGTGRLAATWNMTEVLPESFAEPSDVVTPWGHDEVFSVKMRAPA